MLNISARGVIHVGYTTYIMAVSLHTLTFKNITCTYKLYTRRGQKTVRLSIGLGGQLCVYAPKSFSHRSISRLIENNEASLSTLMTRAVQTGKHDVKTRSGATRKKEFAEARRVVNERIVELNKHYNFTFNRVAIRDQRTRWGSCSVRKNLNFSYRIQYLPRALQNYVVVHELCHLQELNHGPRFWALVADLIPDYVACRKALQAYSVSGTDTGQA